jgi:hypothetical protein
MQRASGERECDREVRRDEAEPYEEVIFGQERPDSVVVDWANKVLFVLEFKRTSDQRRDYKERAESRAQAQHDILIKSLEKVARDADGENEGWKIRLIIFVGGTSGSVNLKTFNDNMEELQVMESKRNAIQKRRRPRIIECARRSPVFVFCAESLDAGRAPKPSRQWR